MGYKWYNRKVEEEKKKIGKAHWKAAEAILTNANDIVPHDEGTLERSGVVTQENLPNSPSTIYSQAKSGGEPKNSFRFDFTKKPIFYISYNTPYAIRLHEADAGEFNFRGQGQRKWLEQTAKKMAKKIPQWIKKEVR